MPDTSWDRIASVLADVLDAPADQRGPILDRACLTPEGTADASLRSEVEAYLDAVDEADAEGALTSPVATLVPEATVIDDVPLGTMVGPWRLTDVLGEGGMGIVYAAERADGQFERQVALKRLRSGPGRRQLAARLRAERQTLARLEHPGVARLYDGGVSEDGTPYLVMERVEGEPITTWVRRTQPSIDARIRLFVQVCEAVAYAHRRLVVHRDLKPSNVFVATAGGDPLAKLLDFGIAKLVGAAGEDASGALTQTAGAAMTPAYAAPEQLAGTEITTATDVYALGVVLYEVLTGERPYDLSGVTAAEAERIVRQTVPPRPSAVAGNRQLAGDLDVIVAKALAKEPERRYESAAALGDDLKRHLDGLPVEAQPATVGYRVGRFVQRHRAGVLVAAAALVVVFGVAGLAFARVSAERDRAQTEADKAQAVTDFLSSTFGAAGPSAGTAVPPSELRVVDALGFAASEATRSFPDQLDVRAAVLHTLGQTLVDLGLYNDALGPLLASLALRDSVHGGRPHPETLETLDALGLVGLWKAESDQDYGALYYRRALTMREALYGETSAEVSRGLANLAETEIERGQFAEAIALAQRALDIARVAEGPMSEAAGDAGFALGRAYGFAGQFRAADSTLTSLLPIARALLPPDDARWGELYTAIGQARLLRGATQAAVDVLEQAATSRAARFDPGHPLLAETQGVLGIALVESGRHQDAEPLLRAALPTFRTGDPYWFYQHATAAVLEASLAQRGLPARLDSARTSAALLADAVGRESPWSQIVERHLESAGG